MLPRKAGAESAGTPREAVADFASGIPGYGPSDVFYPSWFEGDWQATSELVSVEAPQGDSLAGEAALRLRASIGTPAAIERYPQRYVPYREQIIADRAYNVRGLVRSGGGLESVDWNPSNPNLLTVVIKRDRLSVRTDLKVTKRAVGVPSGRESDLFNASEFYQEVVEGGGGTLPDSGVGFATSVPKVTPIRCVNKFRRIAGPQIQVIQRVEVFPSLGSEAAGARDFGDALKAAGGEAGKPVVVYKYRAVLARPSTSSGE